MITTAVASLAGGAAGALEWRRIARRHPDLKLESALPHARHLLVVVPVALALLGVQLFVVTHPDVTWDAPLWIELHHADLLFGSVAACISFVFGLATYGAFATRHRQRMAVPVSMAIVVGIVFAIEWDFEAPIASNLHERRNGEIVLQSSNASCAAASAANLARHYGILRTESEMAALVGTTRFGTSPAQVIQGLKRLGISCQKIVRADVDPTPLHAPAVLFLPGSAGVPGHAVLFIGVDGQSSVVLDPLSGRQLLSRHELTARWKGHAVECNRPLESRALPTTTAHPFL
ncbi:Hypothetical protein A7982_04213 [Minicystis rosea]|nr:Hypothetical protein A7982_04213 [Minicystis rosea]